MKNVLLLFWFSITFFISPAFWGVLSEAYELKKDDGVKTRITSTDSEIERIEYYCIDGQWYMYIFYCDGSLQIIPMNEPPHE